MPCTDFPKSTNGSILGFLPFLKRQSFLNFKQKIADQSFIQGRFQVQQSKIRNAYETS